MLKCHQSESRRLRRLSGYCPSSNLDHLTCTFHPKTTTPCPNSTSLVFESFPEQPAGRAADFLFHARCFSRCFKISDLLIAELAVADIAYLNFPDLTWQLSTMAESGQIRAVFSTKFGRLGYKEARQPVRCIIRSEYWDDVHEMAKSLQKDFPECCDSMTMREVHRLHYYFDPHDIQMHSESFLIHVLELLVCWNYLGSIHRIHDFAAHWTAANPKAYEDVAFNAQVTDVFSKIEIETLGDDFLSSVLNILIQSRFPEGL